MGKLQDRIIEAGQLWGLPPHPNTAHVFGTKDGFAVQMMAGNDGQNETFVGILRWDYPDKDALIQERIAQSHALRDAGVKAKMVKMDTGFLVYTVPFIFGIGMPTPDQMAQRMQALLNEVKAVAGTGCVSCLVCRNGTVDPVLVDGIVARICGACLQKAQTEITALAEAYESIPTRWVRAVLVGSIAALLGAIIWDAVLLMTQRMFLLLAIFIGAMVGWATTKAAGKGGRGVQTLGGGLTMVALLGAMAALFAVGALGSSIQEGAINSSLYQESFLKIVKESMGDIAFTLLGSLIGALTAAAKAAKPAFNLAVQK